MRQLKTFKSEAEDKLPQMEIDKQSLIHRVQEIENELKPRARMGAGEARRV
jgi:hypothetical protein